MKPITSEIAALQGSGILQDALKITVCPPGEATHFVISHGERLKFVVCLDNGLSTLKKTLAAYNKKLKILIHFLPFIPWKLLATVRMGQFVRVKVHTGILKHIPEHQRWNILIGTYDSAQKIVFQCFSGRDTPCIYIKVGNAASDEQMKREINFLRKNKRYNCFSIPHHIYSVLITESNPFNILTTAEFKGNKISPVLTKEIYNISREIAGEPVILNGVPYEFTHGDFAPWNIRKTTSTYTVFDWEHCGLRPAGYDAAYFVIMTEIALHKRHFDEAFDIAIQQLRQFSTEIDIDKDLMRQEFAKTTKSLQF